MDGAASITNGLGCVDPYDASGAKNLVESNPATAAAATAAAGGVEVILAPNREGRRDPLKQSQRQAKHTRIIRPVRTAALFWGHPVKFQVICHLNRTGLPS